MENPRKKLSNNVAPPELGVFLGSLCYHNVASPMFKTFCFFFKKVITYFTKFFSSVRSGIMVKSEIY